MESYDNLRKNMINILENSEGIPSEVMQLIIKIFESIEEKYKEMGCHNSSIESYLQGNLGELIATLRGRLGNEIKEGQYYQIESILAEVRRDLEEKLDDEEQKRRDNKIQDNIGEFSNGGDNNRRTVRIVSEIEDALKDAQSMQNRLLSVRGYSDRKIEEINYEVTHFIRQQLQRGEENILEALKGDEGELKKQLLAAYEAYIHERQENNKSQEESFRESLDARISLDEQRDNALEFQKEAEYKSKEDENEHRQTLADLFK